VKNLVCLICFSTLSWAAKPKLDAVPRKDFNRVAAELALPLFWIEDKNHDGALDPDELGVFWGLDPAAKLSAFVDKKDFTAKFDGAYRAIAKQFTDKSKLDARRAAVVKELSQGRQTLVLTDLSQAPADERAFVGHVIDAAAIIERLYALQMGTADFNARDPASRMMFYRNQSPKCVAPLTQHDPACAAVPGLPEGKLSGLYPAGTWSQPKFCETLGSKDKSLVDPFTVVTKVGDAWKAVPYAIAYRAQMSAVSQHLEAAAKALAGDEKEASLSAYLTAAAQAFRDNNWVPADEAWAKMSVSNSKYYLRIGPDEVYAEPCSNKALFHVSFGLINQKSLKWQSLLEPMRNEMEQALAQMAGPPYQPRDVSFKLPDFIDVILNAGDSRAPHGATIGQSLPNFGPVANEGRGRTVAMINLYTDPDSRAQDRETAESLFCKSTIPRWSDSPEPLLMSTVLHEAAHNLGPAHQYKVNGKIDRDAFGGPLASTLEELKAQSAALYLTEWLVEKGKVEARMAEEAQLHDIAWCFGHISRGMYDEDQHPRNYSQLAAIQLGRLMKDGAITWKANEKAANGKDQGCFDVDSRKMPTAIAAMMKDVAGIKGRGDRAQAEQLVRDYVDVTGPKKATLDLITERVLRAPKPSFIYSVKLE
jgi:hypothetical protein